ncbi:beta strand repeat-containing protein [Vibrio maerlii]|uniref:beta strand repeat-containing protein n=1 Tax=Vibrio maerlii TaxID=2231648 RepID=UPI000E3EB28D|nr:hypothetical protein [Vibrio maerlii]
MEKQWNKVPLAVVIGAILSSPAYAASLDVKAENIQVSADNNVNINFKNIEGTNIANEAEVSGNAFNATSGIIHSNTSAGYYNLGSNNASIAARLESSGAKKDASVSAQSLQGSSGENLTSTRDKGGDGDNTAQIVSVENNNIVSSPFASASGLIGVNVAAGISNLQANNVAMGNAEDAGVLTLEAQSTQQIGGLSRNDNADSEGNNINSLGPDNVAKVDAAFNIGAAGVIGVNVASGMANQQSNSVALANYVSADANYTSDPNDPLANDNVVVEEIEIGVPLTELPNNTNAQQSLDGFTEATEISISSNNSQKVDGNVVVVDGKPRRYQDNSADLSNSFIGASGIVGTNITAGDINAQSNNVSLGVVALGVEATSDDVVTSVIVNSDSAQTIQNNDITYTNNVGNTENDPIPDPLNPSDNTASINSSSFGDFKGIGGANVTAGQANTQANNAALSVMEPNGNGPVDKVSIGANSAQTISGNNLVQTYGSEIQNGADYPGQVQNNANLEGGAFTGARGVIGANIAAGQANAQSNQTAVGYVAGWVDDQGSQDTMEMNEIAASSTQTVTNNSVSTLTADSVDLDETNSEGYFNENNATITGNSFETASGIAGANVAAGQNNAQANNVVVSRVLGDANTTTLEADNTQIITLQNKELPSDEHQLGAIDLTSRASIDTNFAGDMKGVVGVNVAAGQSNAQSNNVAIATYSDRTEGSTVSAGVENNQTISENIVLASEDGMIDNDSKINGSFTSSVTGVLGVNIGAGQSNAQSNNVAFADYEDVGDADELALSAKNTQTVQLNTTTTGDESDGAIDNNAIVSGSFTGSISGVAGVNSAAGQANAQSNNVALSNHTVSGTANGMRIISSDNTQNVGGRSALGNDVVIGNGSMVEIVNSSSISGSFNGGVSGVSGVLGANSVAGQANAQANNLAIGVQVDNADSTAGSRSADGTGLGTVEAVNTQRIVKNLAGLSSEDEEQLGSTTNISVVDSSFTGGVSGVVGVNSTAGQFNAQANNVALTNSSVGGSDISPLNVTGVNASSANVAGVLAVNEQEVIGSDVFLIGDDDTAMSFENTTKVTGSFNGVTGIVGVNNAAGQANAQANNAALASDSDASSTLGSVATAALSLQESDGVDIALYESYSNEASITGSFNNSVKGIIGVNVAAGQANLQANSAALSVNESAVESVAVAGNAQLIGANLDEGANDGSNRGLGTPMTVTLEDFQNTAKLDNSFNQSNGILGVNIASGQLNAQTNNVAVAVSENDASTASTGALNIQLSVINEVDYSVPGQYTATLGGNVFTGASGVIGTNIAVGVGNGQSNNVAMQVTNGDATLASAANVQGSLANGAETRQDAGAVNVSGLEGFTDYSVESVQLTNFAVSDVNGSGTNSQFQSLGNYASIDGGYMGANGVIGVNVAAGVGNLQSNNVTLVASRGN